MGNRLLVALALVSMTLAGCSGDDDSGPSPEELCDGIFADGMCMPHIEPSVVITGLDTEVPAYFSHTFTWSLDNGTRGAPGVPVHSMDSRLIALTDGTVPTNATEPDGVGKEVAKQEHKNLPDNFTATFTWSKVGDNVALWGYMRIDGVHTWNLIQNVSVVTPSPTGVTKTVTIVQGPPPSASPTDVTLSLGDGIQFDNENSLYGYTVSFSCNNGASADSISLGAGATSAAIVILQPTVCSWTATTQASGMGVTQGDLNGQFRVVAS